MTQKPLGIDLTVCLIKYFYRLLRALTSECLLVFRSNVYILSWWRRGIYGVQISVKFICQSNTYYTPWQNFHPGYHHQCE